MKMNPLQYAEARKLTYECPVCCRIAPWTDGRSVQAGDECDEFWCQTCGTETPLEAMTVAENVVYGDGADPERQAYLEDKLGQCAKCGRNVTRVREVYLEDELGQVVCPYDSGQHALEQLVHGEPVLSAAGAAEVVLRVTGLEAGWRRAGSRCYSYHGTLSDGSDVVWTCGHRHPTKPDAVRCAAERDPQTLAECMAALNLGPDRA
jgi:hypothetical protein